MISLSARRTETLSSTISTRILRGDPAVGAVLLTLDPQFFWNTAGAISRIKPPAPITDSEWPRNR